MVGSPLKKARPSISGPAPDLGASSGTGTFPPALGDILAKAEAAQASKNSGGDTKEQPQVKASPAPEVMEEEEEL